jgi:protein SCO1
MIKLLLFALLSLISISPIVQGQVQRKTSQKAVRQYTCPMHSAVKVKSAGRCPKCGMNLVPVNVEKVAEVVRPRSMSIPDVELLDQDGRKIHFYSDLVKGKTVAINFIFTTCTTICPPMGATFASVQKELGNRGVQFISISVDPVTDTPERLKAWRAKFKAGPGWTLVTGEKEKIDELLAALAASTPRREDHSPTTIIGNDALGQWTRAFGLAKPSQLVQIIDQAANGLLEGGTKEMTASEEPTAAAKYFGEAELIDQDGRKVRFYSDVLKGKTVVVNALFTTCTNVCPPISRNLERIQDALGERLGKDVFLVSITVDPVNDTPVKLKAYAEKFHARPGWSFLTGTKENVDLALYKLGQYVQDKNSHKTIVIIGNEGTGLWKKAFGLARSEDLIALVNEVMNDRPQKDTEGAKNEF